MLMFSAQSLLAGNGASVTCLRESREPITTLNLATYVTPLVVRNFWLWFSHFNNEGFYVSFGFNNLLKRSQEYQLMPP